MILAAREALRTAEGGTPIPFFPQRFLAPCCRMGPYAQAAWGRHRGLRSHETAGILHRVCRNRRSNRLRRRPDRRAVVAGNKSAGIPRRLLLRAETRVAGPQE